jgi:hypothetical protein
LLRRVEFTDIYGDLVARQVVTPAKAITAILRGPASADRAGRRGCWVPAGEGDRRRLGDQTSARDRAAPRALRGDALDIRDTIVLKMREMTADDFEQLLRPAFKQDEWKLIAVGAVLGFLVGELQTLLVEVFSH